mmetsp:Transcript_8241/g.6141  ORF Transcript_8241/g.6141 Transcript_8241/m.6141 type:complete len:119 (+) Transcript_8241:1099-1455(+)
MVYEVESTALRCLNGFIQVGTVDYSPLFLKHDLLGALQHYFFRHQNLSDEVANILHLLNNVCFCQSQAMLLMVMRHSLFALISTAICSNEFVHALRAWYAIGAILQRADPELNHELFS